jgi:hypothetical protein
MLDASGKPTPRLRASALREELEGRLQRLQDLEQRLLDAPEHTAAGGLRVDFSAVAVSHLRRAINALEMASWE